MLAFYSEELLAFCPIPKLEDHPFSAVDDCSSVLQLPSISGGHFLCPQPEDMPYHNNKDLLNIGTQIHI
jgi:hypothetical protein